MNKKLMAVSAAAAAGLGICFLLTKNGKKAPAKEARPAGANAKKAAPKNTAQGTYSFVSGFQDAATVDVAVNYDAERFDFYIVEEGFLCSTSDSHVAVMYGADFNVQLEYVPFYAGDCFESVRENAKSRLDFTETPEGFRYVDGDSVYNCLPVDDFSFLLVTAMLSKGSELKFAELPEASELKELVGGIQIGRAK